VQGLIAISFWNSYVVLKFILNSLGIHFVIRYVDDDKEYDEELRTLTGNTLVPVLLNKKNGRIMIGCPVDMDKFFEEFLSILGCINKESI
jgi:hypothetical protein